jgi:hypothetical protein
MMKFLKAFTVNNSDTNEIDVIDLSDPTNPKLIASINLTGLTVLQKCGHMQWKTSSSFRSTKQTRFGESSRFDTAKLYRN